MVEILSPRPPTPPRPLSQSAEDSDSPVIIQTPKDNPPFSVSESTGNDSSRHSKRVNFSPWTNYIKPLPFSHPSFKVPRPSNECKPPKSILKTPQTPSPVTPVEVASDTPESFVMLLDSVTQQLAGDSMSSKQDAYMHLLGALKAYKDLPGEQEILAKLDRITQFIQRDISRDPETGGPLESNLAIYALKLSIVFIWHREISRYLSDDFKVFLVDQSINCLQDARVSKSILVHYMHILSAQNFSSRIMTSARLTRLITALHDVTNRANGSAIVLQRLNIYQRVLGQSKSVFVSYSDLWMEHLISGLLHPVKDTRQKAISLGSQTAMAFGPNPTLSKCVRGIFNKTIGKGRKLASEICERMWRMMTPVESGINVPQIWGIIILLLRDKKSSLDQWEYFKDWLFILQKCFNCSEPAIKSQAILAWNRFVFAISPHEMTSRSVLKSLSRPILIQFERKKHESFWTSPNQLSLCSYYNLLYYGFRPSASYQQFDMVWQEFLELPSSKVFSVIPALSDRTAQALSHLMWSSQAKVWSEFKVNESDKFEPEELLSLDCKWIRSRINMVLGVFESIFKSSVWDDLAVERSNIAVAWVGLSKALSHASSKEITPSTEAMHAVASVLGLLRRLWDNIPASLNALGDKCYDKFYERFRFLSTTMISMIGSISFTEKLLLKNADETFQAANTPQHRHTTSNANLGSPILHLLRLISKVSTVADPSSSYMHLVEDTLEVACNGKTSRGSRLELLRQCAEFYLPEGVAQPGQGRFCEAIWKVVATFSATCLRHFPNKFAKEHDAFAFRDYENVVKVLSSGLSFPGAFSEWGQLLDSLVCVMKTEVDNTNIATSVIDPVAERIIKRQTWDSYLMSAKLFDYAPCESYCREDDTNMKRNDTTNPISESGSSQSSFALVRLAYRIFEEAYTKSYPLENLGFADFLESFASFLSCGPLSLRARVFEDLQRPFSTWLNDKNHKLVESGAESRVIVACNAIVSVFLSILRESEPHEPAVLRRFKMIICAGLDSTNKHIAEDFSGALSAYTKEKPAACPGSILRVLNKPNETFLNAGRSSNISSPKRQAGSNNYISLNLEEKENPLTVNGFNQAEPSDDPFVSHGGEMNDIDPLPVVEINDSPKAAPVEKSAISRERKSEDAQAQAAKTHSPSLPANGARSQVPEAHQSHRTNEREKILKAIYAPRSSPSKTPRRSSQLLFAHCLRERSGLESTTGTPQTPTFPAAKTYGSDSCLGSSPTPAARSRAPAARLGTPATMAAQGELLNSDADFPSSPPEVVPRNSDIRSGSKTAMPSNRAVGEDTGAAEIGDKIVTIVKNPNGFCETNAVEDTAKEERERTYENGETAGSQAKCLHAPLDKQAPSNTIPTDASARNVHEGMAQQPGPGNQNHKPEPGIAVEIDQGKQTNHSSNCNGDLSDDEEVQIASQLIQDMEHAADVEEYKGNNSDDSSTNSLPTKKRKRTGRKTSKLPKGSRRSSRLAKPSSDDSPRQRATRTSRRSMGPGQAQNDPNADSLPAQPAVKRRKFQTKEDGSVFEVSKIDDDDAEKHSEAPESVLPATCSTPKTFQKPRVVLPRAASNEVQGAPLENKSRAEEPIQEKPTGNPDNDDSRSRLTNRVEENDTPNETPQSEIPESAAPAQIPIDTEMGDTNLEPAHEPLQDGPEMPDAEMASAEHPMISNAIQTETPSEMVTADRPSKQEHAESRACQTEPSPSDVPTNTNVFDTLRQALSDVKRTSLSQSALRQVDDLLFDIRVETHEASRRHRVG